LLARPASGAVIITIFVWLVFAVIAGANGFLGLSGTLSYLDVAAQVGILATSVALLMIAGEFDLSIGSLVAFGAVIIGIGATTMGLPVWLSILAAIVLTTLLGVVNGLLVVRTGLPSFIVTLATLFLIKGLTIVLTASITNITYIPISREVIAADPIAWIFNWTLPLGGGAEVKVSIIWWILIAAIGAYIYSRTRFGNWIAGVGGSPTAARNLGVPVARVKVVLFASTAFSASILAAITSMTFFSADVLRGEGMELDAITTAVIGGTLLTGGYGSVVGTFVGALALGMSEIAIFFANINADWYKVALGTLLLVSVVLNNWIRRRYAGLR
jgi:simple sugar transport system permease protein